MDFFTIHIACLIAALQRNGTCLLLFILTNFDLPLPLLTRTPFSDPFNRKHSSKFIALSRYIYLKSAPPPYARVHSLEIHKLIPSQHYVYCALVMDSLLPLLNLIDM